MANWDTFSVVTGGIAGALVGLFFVAVSIHAQEIMRSVEVRNRSAQTVVDFGVVLLAAVLLSVPEQPPRVPGAELLALGLVSGSFWKCWSGRPGRWTPSRWAGCSSR